MAIQAPRPTAPGTTATGATTAAEHGGGSTSGGSTFLRVSIALQTLTIFLQALSSGLLMTTSYGEVLHGVGARVMYGATMIYVLAAVLAWKPGGGSPRPILHATGFLVLASVQVAVGIAHIPAVHLPLGVLMFGLSVLALTLTRRR
ncbi:hypothetical protein OG897_07885 [Streptomyces sp. NBC_00237]|uniref:hypothetical protein n=1 Tax=Streptomyces sp. NBC_00237 TaxID=2975687 RepID=UPI002254AB58|nr:hypothetical protein [Streptomyces sp. NBC_00237]MCX5201371.1 hypothetical protein [Streptomyces sp. NBC_00237]